MSGLLRCFSPSWMYLSVVSTTMVSPLSAFLIMMSFLFRRLFRVVRSAIVRLSLDLVLLLKMSVAVSIVVSLYS